MNIWDVEHHICVGCEAGKTVAAELDEENQELLETVHGNLDRLKTSESTVGLVALVGEQEAARLTAKGWEICAVRAVCPLVSDEADFCPERFIAMACAVEILPLGD
jgi:hypothetical protein